MSKKQTKNTKMCDNLTEFVSADIASDDKTLDNVTVTLSKTKKTTLCYHCHASLSMVPTNPLAAHDSV